MEEKDILILQGLGMLMEMVLSSMPSAMAEKWFDDINEYNQKVTDLIGNKFKKSELKEE